MRLGALLLVALGAAACGSTSGGPDYEAAWRAEPELTGPDLDRLVAAIGDLEAGRAEPARDALRVIATRRRDVFLLQRWLQEAELAVAQERAEFLRAAGDTETPDPLTDLRESYRDRAEESGTATDLVLAARIEDDAPAALHLLDRAVEADPLDPWAWYGRAHVSVLLGRWKDAREALQRCLELNPRHLQALRLSAWIQAEAGSRDAAIDELSSWIALAGDDPTVEPGVRDAARLDLALLLVQEGESNRALRLIDQLEDSSVDPVRRFTALAAVCEARGEYLDALEAINLARDEDPQALLPVVQEALLIERHFGDPRRALKAWRLALELSRQQKDLGAVLQRTRAEVHIGRLERQLAATES
ncbi:MAG: tetratricopeptide repeat protein [Planctomycetes bacterium]|nr:tetratricopeptide repeat protein [Planctomycetota bacterium]MCB9905724.1 tetratricopeptide repeat protein [Planctomycetota bacterium]